MSKDEEFVSSPHGFMLERGEVRGMSLVDWTLLEGQLEKKMPGGSPSCYMN